MVHDTFITATDIIKQLTGLPDMSAEDANSLLNPTDRQNVPKAVSLIQHLQLVHDLSLLAHPGEQNSQDKLNFMSKMLGYFVLPFIIIEKTLSQQLELLSTFSHLAAAMFIVHGVACLTGALYADAQSIVKNIFITVAQLQVTDRTLNFYILLEGTDRLENLFCECRTQDHARNFDIKQLAQKLSVATLINATYERNPDINRGHRKLDLQGATGIDRINPKSWEGDTCVGNVDLLKEWNSGRKKALTIMEEYFGPEFAPDFIQIFSQPKRDILRPMGDYVGIKATADDARSEEEILSTIVPGSSASLQDVTADTQIMPTIAADTQITPTDIPLHPNNIPPTSNIPGPPTEESEENDNTFENLATIVAFAADIDIDNAELIFEGDKELEDAEIELDELFPEIQELDKDAEPEIFSHKLVEGDKEYLKSALVATLRPDQWKRLAVQPFRVQGKTLEDLYSTSRSGVDLGSSLNANELCAKDLVAFLVQSANKFCLAVMEVVGYRFKKEKALKLTMGVEQLTNGNGDFRVNGQIIELSPSLDGTDAWDWMKCYVHLDVASRTEHLTQAQFILEVPASLVYPMAAVPVRSDEATSNANGKLTWRINRVNLDDILNTAWDTLNGEGDDILGNLPLLPKIVNPNVIPYKYISGESIYSLRT